MRESLLFAIRSQAALADSVARASAFVLKRRDAEGRVHAFVLSGEVRNRPVVLRDDMIRTGDTLLRAAEACLAAGATEVGAAAVHGAFAPGALDTLRASGLIQRLHCSDSLPAGPAGKRDWPVVSSCARVLADSLVGSRSER